MAKRREILKQVGIYSIGTQIAQVITLVAAIISRRFLGPMQTGIWSTLQILVDYSKYSTLGTMEAISREIPYFVGRGESRTAEKLKNLAFTFVFTGSGLVCMAIFIFALFTRGRFPLQVTYGLLFVTGLILLQRFNNLLIALLRCYKKFEIEARLMILSALWNAVLVAVLTYLWKIYGFIWALILSFIFNILYVCSQYRFNFRWGYDAKQFKPLVTYGFPLMLLGLLTLGLKSIDKILIARLLGFESLGFYSIALMTCSYISNFSISVAIVFLPHLQEKIAGQTNKEELKKYIFKASLGYALTLPAFVGCVWILLPYGIALFLPKFTSGIRAAQVLVLSMFFAALTQPYYDFLAGTKRHFSLFPILGIVLLVTSALDFWVIQAGFGIVGVALATNFSVFLNFTMMYFLASKHLANLEIALQKYLVFVGCAAYFLIPLLLIDRWIPFWNHSIQIMTLRLSLFLIFYVPAFIILEREFSITSFVGRLGIKNEEVPVDRENFRQ